MSSKKRLFQSLAQIAAPELLERQDTIAQALIERESLGPTGVGRGVALPHARLDGVDDIFGCFVRLEKPIDFSAVDRQPVDLVFALFGPISGGVNHLKALAAVSRTLRDETICGKLRMNSDPATLYELILGGASARAAA